MELYILDNSDLSILSILECSNYEINLDNQFTDKSTFRVNKAAGQVKDNFLVVNGLYQQFLFKIDEVEATDKEEKFVNLVCSDISNIFNRKIIEQDTELMNTRSIEYFLAHMIDINFINSNDSFLNKDYIEVTYNEHTQAKVQTNAENGIYNFHTFMENCREYQNVYTDFKIEDKKLKITISYKNDTPIAIDTTLSEVTHYNKVYEQDITAKVQVYIRENGEIRNYFLKTDRTITTNINDPNRASGAIEVISVETPDDALQEATNVFKGNTYKHLVEFSISKNSKLVDTSILYIGRPIIIKTPDGVYESIISGISLDDDNYVNFKSGNIRINFIDKLKQEKDNYGNKLDVTGGIIKGNLTTQGNSTTNGDTTTTGKTTTGSLQSNGDSKIDGKLDVQNNIVSQNGTIIGKMNNRPQAVIGSDVSGSAGWYKVCTSTMSFWGNTNITWLVANNYSSGHKGILSLEMRSNNGTIQCWQLKWLVRSGFNSNWARLTISGNTWTLYFYRENSQYGRTAFHELVHDNINGNVGGYTVTYFNSTTKESSEPAANTTSSDGFIVQSANSMVADGKTTLTNDIDTANTNDTWIPVISSGKFQHTYRKFASSQTHTNYNTNQDYLATMSFLSFWNGAYNSGGGSNLTYCNGGTIQPKPTSLYDNGTGTTGTVTLSQTAANFNYLEIFYRKHNNYTNASAYGSVKVFSPNNKKANLVWGAVEGSSTNQVQFAVKTISGTQITHNNAGYVNFETNAWSRDTNTNEIYIVKVIGWK